MATDETKDQFKKIIKAWKKVIEDVKKGIIKDPSESILNAFDNMKRKLKGWGFAVNNGNNK